MMCCTPAKMMCGSRILARKEEKETLKKKFVVEIIGKRFLFELLCSEHCL